MAEKKESFIFVSSIKSKRGDKVMDTMKLLSHTEDEETVNTVSEEMVPYKTKAELLADWEEVCDAIKSAREGKIKGRSVEELLNEL